MKPTAAATAPGRLDFLGGVADYSGSLVLEMPIRAVTRVAVARLDSPEFRLASSAYYRWRVPSEGFLDARCENEARQWLAERHAPRWTYYLLGSLWVLCRAKGLRLQDGLSFRVRSRVPEGMGVSSSAALEVAALRALGRLMGARWEGTELARYGQQAENRVVGAPCGLMDQLAVEHGKPGCLLPIVCRPDIVREPVPLPRGVVVVGWASGVKHAVSGSPYATARAATFMGKRIFEEKMGRSWDYAAKITPSLFDRFAPRLMTESINGRSFAQRYGKTDDPLSNVDQAINYRVRSALRFPIKENFRAELAESLLRGGEKRLEPRLRQTGELMLASHAGYSALGLGSPETDQMVDALMSLGPEQGVYGGRASGGGSGGTVVVLLKKRALENLAALAKQVQFNGTSTTLIR